MITPFLCPGLRSAFSPEPIGADGGASVGNLWEWARFCFERLVVRIESARSLADRRRMTRRYRRDYLAWLEPVERLVRCLILARACHWLTQTGEGRRMLARTPRQPLPGPQPAPARTQQQQQQQQQESNNRTAGQHQDYEEQDLKPLTRTPEEIEAAYLALPVRREQTGDPATWICPFAILRFDRSHPPSEDGWHGTPSGLAYEEIAALDYIPHVRSQPRTHGGNHGPSLRPRGVCSAALKLARRVEALGRVLANPEPRVRRAARLLARLPAGVLDPPGPPPPWWMQGKDIILAAIALLTPLLDDLNRIKDDEPEPG